MESYSRLSFSCGFFNSAPLFCDLSMFCVCQYRRYRIHSGKSPSKQQTREGEETDFRNSQVPLCTMFSFKNKKKQRCKETDKYGP